ncbi:ATP-dependent RNA helicase [Saccharomycopsis crataegensis]|uniref:ATP-dependent RNA helicase n=1 Tax=Saccharomycopsis crataegensis TaxID=43959 RepID=A0AAV5QTZ1_9ASCO|nr:ATP-dependent RNA helicase [Saccharomycopsis crataegensis]
MLLPVFPKSRLPAIFRGYATEKYGGRFNKFSKKRISPAPSIKRQSKPKKARQHEFGDTLRHGFGELNGLANIDKIDNVKSNVGVRSRFLDYKILEEVRDFFTKEIKQYSLLYQHQKIRESKQTEDNPTPTDIQKLAFSEILKPRNSKNPYELRIFSIAGETGCGKTYAYMIPLINNLKTDQMNKVNDGDKKKKIVEYNENFTKTQINSVILLPTNELIEQLYDVLKNISELGLTVSKLNFENKVEDLIALNKPVDILVTTPVKFNAIKNYAGSSQVYRKLVSSIKYCVIDEADTLLDRSFLSDTMTSFHQISNMSGMVKDLVIVSSTISKLFNKNLNEVFKNNNIIKICSKRIHRISKKLDMRVIDCNMKPFRNSKMNALKQCLYSIYCDNTEADLQVKKVLVFVNEKESVSKIYGELCSDDAFKGYEIYKITGENSIEDRMQIMKDFNSNDALLEDALSTNQKSSDKTVKIPNSNIKLNKSSNNDSTSQPRLKVLVTTDILSRGINFQQTSNSVLYDIPKTTADLVNRVGRVGRIGLPGRVFMLAAKGESKGWVTGLPKAVKNGTPLA